MFKRRVRRRWKIWRVVVALLFLYLAAGYLVPRLSWIPARPSIEADAYDIPALRPAGVRAAGVLHVHTQRSHDAVGSESEVARAARAADIDYVIITDHRSPNARDELWQTQARYEEGVLLIRGQEISLGGEVGRTLVFGLDTTLTGWEGGLEGFGELVERRAAGAIVAHSRSPRVRDSWRPREAPGILGWEVFDFADIGRTRLADPWVAYHVLALAVSAPLGRTHRSLPRLYRRGFEQPGVAAFDSLYPWNRFTAVGGLDAHPKTQIGDRLVPGYESFFKSMVNHVELATPLPADAARALEVLADGLRGGGVFISFGDTQLARNFVLLVTAPGTAPVGIGRAVSWRADRYLRAGFWGGPNERLLYRVMLDGRQHAWVSGAELTWPVEQPGIYRVEVYGYSLRIGPLVWNLRPWIFANPNWIVRTDE